jgi:aminoglycoside phosphotransferase (APT) family kinase protein
MSVNSDEMRLTEGLLGLFAEERAGIRPHITSLLPITGGWETEVYLFRVTWDSVRPEAGEPYILRLYPGTDAPVKSGRERGVLHRLHGAGYPVPKVLSGSSDPYPFGKPWLIMEKIEGPSLGEAYARAGEGDKLRLLELFCRTLVQLHQLDWRVLVDDPSPYEGDTNDFIGRELGKWSRFVTELGYEEWEDFLKVRDWLEGESSSVPPLGLCGIHMDFHPQNVLLSRDEGRPYVIDWGGFDVGDLRYDLAWTLLVTGGDDLSLRQQLLQTYQSLADIRVEHLDFFDAMAAARRLFSIALSMKAGAGRLGMRPGMEEQFKARVPYMLEVYRFLQSRTGLVLHEFEREFFA